MGNGIRTVGPVNLLTGGDMSQASVASKALNVASMIAGNLEAIWTGTPTGTFSLQASNDAVNWYDTGTAIQAPAGGAASTMVEMTQIGFTYVRLKYTKTSGAGSLTVNGMAKAAA